MHTECSPSISSPVLSMSAPSKSCIQTRKQSKEKKKSHRVSHTTHTTPHDRQTSRQTKSYPLDQKDTLQAVLSEDLCSKYLASYHRTLSWTASTNEGRNDCRLWVCASSDGCVLFSPGPPRQLPPPPRQLPPLLPLPLPPVPLSRVLRAAPPLLHPEHHQRPRASLPVAPHLPGAVPPPLQRPPLPQAASAPAAAAAPLRCPLPWGRAPQLPAHVQ
mmetsp:Transcript_45659/g.113433  ORF Transcript_45659/g.113433 Transcript_45659/m.113433 type:complete len:216 (-) Transcript_45659:488-1135(-)